MVANTIAIRHSYGHTKVAIELGGQDAKVIFFHHDAISKKIISSDMRMNGSCAGGTGAFIDQIAELLKMKAEDFEGLARNGTNVFDISGRCGVFAKTDVQPLLNQGILKEDIALSAFHALAKQTIGGLAQGMDINPPIIFEGGPFHFNPTLINVFVERLGLEKEEIIVPEKPEIIVAYGTALSIGVMFDDKINAYKGLESYSRLLVKENFRINSGSKVPQRYFANAQEKSEFFNRHKPEPEIQKNFVRGSKIDVYLGIDAGSTTTKFVLIDGDENVIYKDYINNEGEPVRVFQKALINLREKFKEYGVTLNIIAVGTTGYGELLFSKAFQADYHTVETVSHAEAAMKYEPDVSFVLDIGGQDMKAIKINDGIITSITLNEACSAGCGSFLETFAKTLQIAVDEIENYAFESTNLSELGSRCTIFMGSSIITEQKNGKSPQDILGGLCKSIIENIFTKVVRVSNIDSLGEKIVVQGGTFKNMAVLRAFEQYAGKEIIRAPFPGEMGAIGIAILTKKYAQTTGFSGNSSFIGLVNLDSFGYTNHPGTVCGFCSNNCNRNLIKFNNGNHYITGNKCEKGEIIGNLSDQSTKEKINAISNRIKEIPNMIQFREKLLFKNYSPELVSPKKGLTIGIPRALEFWNSLPFWKAFFTALGYKVVVSRKSDAQLFENGLQSIPSDTICFPAKIAHGHILDLIDRQVDMIFMPAMGKIPHKDQPKSYWACVIVQGYPYIIKECIEPEDKFGIKLYTPIFHWYDFKIRDAQLIDFTVSTFKLKKGIVKKAIIQGDIALEKFKNEMDLKGQSILNSLNKPADFAVLIAGRCYHNDSFINHNIAKYFTKHKIPVLTNDSIPGLMTADLKNVRPEPGINFHAEMYCSAIYAANHPNLELVQIVSFGCGHDAIISDEIERIMREISGNYPLILKLDESDVVGPLNLRVKSFIETVVAKRKHESKADQIKNVNQLTNPYSTKFTVRDKKERTVLVPHLSRSFNTLVSAVLQKEGFNVECVPIATDEAIVLGKKYVHNDICYPAQLNVGEILLALKSGRYDPETSSIGLFKSCDDCRLINYAALTRKALDEAGFENVPIATTASVDERGMHPGFKITMNFQITMLYGMTMVGALDDMAYGTRPYELNKGETEVIYNRYLNKISANIRISKKLARESLGEAVLAFNNIPVDRSIRKPRVLIIGELLLNYHSVSNMQLEEYLEKNGMEIVMPRFIQKLRRHNVKKLDEINKFHVKFSFLERLLISINKAMFNKVFAEIDKIEQGYRFYEHKIDIYKRFDNGVTPMIDKTMTCGEGWILPEEILACAEEGVKTFIVVGPFGCLPNHISGRGMFKAIKKRFADIQLLALDFDPDTSFGNIENRLQMLIIYANELEGLAQSPFKKPEVDDFRHFIS